MPFRVVICDDESYIANSTAMLLRMHARWELDVHVFDAPAQALQCLLQGKVDVLIADIHMPGMSGLELMKHALALWPVCQVILLTAHSVFEYVYEAIRHDHVDYVLKCDGHEALLAAAERAFERLENTAKREMVYEKAKDQANHAQPYLQRELMLDLIHGVPYSQEKLRQLQGHLNLPLDVSRPMAMWVMLMQVYSREESFLDRSGRMNMVLALGRQYLSENIRLLAVQLDNQQILCLLQEENGGSIPAVQLEGALENLQQATSEQLGIAFSAIYSADVPDYRHLKQRYEKIRRSQAAMAIGRQEMWLLPLEEQEQEQEEIRLMDGRYPAQARFWRHAFENGDPASQDALEELLLPLTQAASMQDPVPLEMYMHLCIQVATIIRNGRHPDFAGSGVSLHALFHGEKHPSGALAADYIRKVVAAIRRQREETTTSSMQQIVTSVIRYVKEHLGEDVSLSTLADHVGINATYLSRVFRKATGETLMSYIAAEKMKQAFLLLSDPNMRIQQICQALGFYSPAYFSYFFKKNAGITPSEYREKNMRQ